MPITLSITVGGVTTDYTRFLNQDSVQIQEDINIPVVMKMSLNPFGNFTVPPPRAYVDLFSTKYNRSLFTGFISSPPEINYLALAYQAKDQGGQLFRYDVTCVSDEYLLNVKAIPFIPAYINRTQGQILIDIANTLCSGFFDTTMVASGDLVPFFEYSPQQSWSEVAKLFGDGSRYRYRARNKKITYQPYGDGFLGIEYNEATQTQGQFAPADLKTNVLQLPAVNDITIIGDVEAGTNWEDYFIGDGFTGNFPLRHQVFRGASSMLLQETWANASLNTQQWLLEDFGDNFDFSAGALNVITASGIVPSLGLSFLAINNGLELAGGINLEHGEFNFNDFSRGVIGGVYPDSTYASGIVAGRGTTAPLDTVLSAFADAYIAKGYSPPYVSGAYYSADRWNYFFRLIPGVMTQDQFFALFFPNGPLQPDDAYTSAQWASIVIGAGYSAATVTPSWDYNALTSIIAAYLIDTPFGVGPPGVSGGVDGVYIQPYAAGLPLGDPIRTQPNHTYVLQTVITAPKYTRYTRTYRTVDGEEFGGEDIETAGSVTFLVQDYDIFAATGFFYSPTVTKVTVNNLPMPSFAAYALINNLQLNITDSSTTLALMPLGTLQSMEGPLGLQFPTGAILPMLPPGSGGYIGGVQPWASQASANILPPPLMLLTGAFPQLVMGNGFSLQDAQVVAGQSADTLAFYAQSLPAAGTPIRYQSWQSQAAVSRLQNSGSIAIEKAIVGDDGLRSAIVTDLKPLPRTSEDCDNAALALLQDRSSTLYNGTYTCTTLFFVPPATGDFQLFPTPGRFLHVNAPRRGIPNQKMLVTSITTTLLDMKTDLIKFVINFGADLYLEKVLHNFVDLTPPQVLTSFDKANPPDPRLTINVGNSFLPDLDQLQVSLSGIGPSGAQFFIEHDFGINSNGATDLTAYLNGIVDPAITGGMTRADIWLFYYDLFGYQPLPGGIVGQLFFPSGRPPSLSGYQQYTAAQFVNIMSAAGYVADFSGNIEVRRRDANWGRGVTPDLVTLIPVTGGLTKFSLDRRQFDQLWYMRLAASGKVSRRSKAIRIRWPMRPLPPLFVSVNGNLMQFNYNGDVRSIYGFELRTPPVPQQGIFTPTGWLLLPGSGQIVLYQVPATSYANLNVDAFNATPLSNSGPLALTTQLQAIASTVDPVISGITGGMAIANVWMFYFVELGHPALPQELVNEVFPASDTLPITIDQFVAGMTSAGLIPDGQFLYAYFFNHQWDYSEPLIVSVSGLLAGSPGAAPFTVLREQYSMLTINDTELTQDEGIGSLKQMNFFGPSIDDTDPGFFMRLGAIAASGNTASAALIYSGSSRLGKTINAGDYGVWNDPPNYEVDQIISINLTGNVVVLQRVDPSVFTPAGKAYFGSPKTAHATGGNFYRLEPKIFSQAIQPNAFGTASPVQAGLPAKYEWAYPDKTLVSLTSQSIGDAGVGPLFTLPLTPTGAATLPPCPGFRTMNGAAYHIGALGVLALGQTADARIKFQAWSSLRTIYGYVGTAPTMLAGGSLPALVITVVYVKPDGSAAGLLENLTVINGQLVTYPSSDMPDGRQMPYHNDWVPTLLSPYDYPPTILSTLTSILDPTTGKLQLGFGVDNTVPIIVEPDGDIDFIITQIGDDVAGSDLVVVVQT